MENRATQLNILRPNLNLDNTDQDNELLHFQNKTLRPVLKFQNEVFVLVFRAFAQKFKQDLSAMQTDQRNRYIELHMQKDKSLQKTMIGMTIGLFTLDEFNFYLLHKSKVNKRIISMLVQRLTDQLHEGRRTPDFIS